MHPVPSSVPLPARQGRHEPIFPIDPEFERPAWAGLGKPVLVAMLAVSVPVIGWLGYRTFLAPAANAGASGPHVTCVAFSPDGQTVAVSEGGSIRICDVASGQVQRVLPAPWDVVRGLAFTPDGKTLALAGARGEIQLWDVATGRPQTILRSGDEPGAVSVQVEPLPPQPVPERSQ